MSELTCSCPHCGDDLNVESDFAGQAVTCPSCNGEFEVPEAPAGNAPVVPQAPALAPAPKLNLPGAAQPPQQAQAPYQQQPPQQQQPPYPQQPPQQQQPPPQSPYQSPGSNIGGPQAYGYGGGPNPNSIQLFAQTKPWVTMFAVLGSIGPALTLILGLLVAFGGAAAGEAVGGIGGGLVIAAFGAIYFLPAWRMWQYSSAINQLRIMPSPQTLDVAIDKQRCFWKTVGIITLVGFALAAIMMFIVISAGAELANEADLSLEP